MTSRAHRPTVRIAPEDGVSPGWMIVGWSEIDGRHFAVGAPNLVGGQLDLTADYVPGGPPSVRFTATGQRYVIAWGASYAEAVAKLFNHFDPDSTETLPALGPSREGDRRCNPNMTSSTG